MSIENYNEKGNILISEETIVKAAAVAAFECYGIVGMASQKKLKDGVFEILGKENISKGVILKKDGEETTIELNVVVMYGVKISEVAKSVQEKVYFDLKNMGIEVEKVNVNIRDVQVNKDEK